MIISDKYRFVFVHIPKCAGIYIRSLLQDYDDSKGKFSNRVDFHPDFESRIDYVHLPLAILESSFPKEYAKLLKYDSFTVVRDPYERFASSFAQHLRTREGKQLQQMDSNEIEASLRKAIAWLQENGKDALYLPEYIHFMPQVCFINNGGVRVVKNIFPVACINDLIDYASTVTGNKLSKDTAIQNPTFIYRNSFVQKSCETVRPIYSSLKRIIPRSLIQFTKKIAFDVKKKTSPPIFKEDWVRSFVTEFYKDDITLYEEACLPFK